MTETRAGVVVGIDLGTTNSLVSILRDGVPVVLPNALGEHLTPSAVSLDDDGRILVGSAARSRAATHPERTVLAWKRDMGTAKTYRLGDRTYRPEELSALVLASLRHDVEVALGEPVAEAVVTVPAYFGDLQRQATKDAAKIAGLHVERIVNEPTAAALAYGLHRRGEDMRIVVLDLGGGTFDVTVLEVLEGMLEIRGTAGDARLGGDDFAAAIVRWAGERLDEAHGPSWRKRPVSVARLEAACEVAKRKLSSASEATVTLPAFPVGDRFVDVELRLSRGDAETLFAPLLERMRVPILRALRDASVLPSAIERVLLVGGATRMPSVKRLARELFGREPLDELPPDEAVAFGAAVQAALKMGDEAVDDLVVTDVAPFTLGISTATSDGVRMVEGIFSPVIDRGTVIPVSRVQRYHTLRAHQTEMDVEIYQGEHSLCRDNTKLGTYRLKKLPKRPAGEVQIDVRFTYDMNGLLEVEMTVVGTGRVESIVIERNPGQLSQDAIAKARDAMRNLKFHPRDSLPNRTALARGEAAFAELVGDARQVVGMAIADLRTALESQDPATIDPARRRLLELLDTLASPR